MMWNFKREESDGGFNTNIPEGNHRIRLREASKAVSSGGNDMLVLKFEASGYKEDLYHYITFLPDKPEVTNRNLTQFFDSFKDIKEGDLNMEHWIGCTGACVVKHEDYKGNTKSKIDKFIPMSQQDSLPAWKGSDSAAEGFVNVPQEVQEQLPF